MYIVITVSLIALFLSFLESRRQLKNGMKLGFILITIIGAIHYNYGNDYMSYYDIYEKVTEYGFDSIILAAENAFVEPGWAFLCMLFKRLGFFFVMIASLNVIQNTIVYNFIRKEVDRRWWPLSVFIYLFSTNFYLLSFSMMRQELVMIVFLGLWPYIKNRHILIPLISILLCCLIHSSSIILIPFVFIGFIPIKNQKLLGCSLAVILAVLWLNKGILTGVFSNIIGIEMFETYMVGYGLGDAVQSVGIGFIVGLIPFFLSVYYISLSPEVSEKKTHMVLLSAVAFLIAPFSQIIQLLDRIGYYFSIYSIGAFPVIYGAIQNKSIRMMLLSVLVVIMLYSYMGFYSSPVWKDNYTTFHTIFEVL